MLSGIRGDSWSAKTGGGRGDSGSSKTRGEAKSQIGCCHAMSESKRIKLLGSDGVKEIGYQERVEQDVDRE